MFKLLGLKWKKEFEELASLKRIELAEKDAELGRLKKELEHQHKLDLEEAIALHKLEFQQKTKQMELDFNRNLQDQQLRKEQEILHHKERLNKEFYENLTQAMSKLHQEGNLTTQFVQDLAFKMFEKSPETKIKVLTNTEQK